MRIATWNVNSLKARLDKVRWWLDRARPDVLVMQETKLRDEAAPVDVFRDLGYELAHHGEGRWNGVAIASRVGITGEVFVLKAGPAYELLATNTMDEVVMATPAISDGLMVVRTLGHVVGLGEKPVASK